MTNQEKENQIQVAVKSILEALGEDTNRDGLTDTPARVARAWVEMTRGNERFPDSTTVFPSQYTGIVFRQEIPFSSTCEHHMLPYIGTIDFAYIPDGKVLGISKIIRLFRHYTAKLSIQEDLTESLIKKFEEIVSPRGCAIRICALHSCESARGVVEHDVPTVTMSFTGAFKEDTNLSNQFLNLITASKSRL
ncbi:MAG: GTP cyclohydrolase I [bacterium]|nr:GTP cyclohydrolase I [bacterium]